MKELSIEEKAKRYDKAIEKAEKWHNAPNVDKIPTFGNRIIEDIFPELKESEDEKMRKSIIYALRNGGFYNNDKTDEAIAWLEKQGGQKSINDLTQQETMNIADTKFKFGDWIVYNRNDHSRKIMQIYDIRDNRYYFNDDIHFSWSVKECDEKSHLWTIKDAKDGDVLRLGCVIAIFKSIFKNSIGNPKCVCYCSFCENGVFEIPKENGEDNVYGCTNTTPATQEERDLLFRKMKEAGYEWNKDKKKLIKL